MYVINAENLNQILYRENSTCTNFMHHAVSDLGLHGLPISNYKDARLICGKFGSKA